LLSPKFIDAEPVFIFLTALFYLAAYLDPFFQGVVKLLKQLQRFTMCCFFINIIKLMFFYFVSTP